MIPSKQTGEDVTYRVRFIKKNVTKVPALPTGFPLVMKYDFLSCIFICFPHPSVRSEPGLTSKNIFSGNPFSMNVPAYDSSQCS